MKIAKIRFTAQPGGGTRATVLDGTGKPFIDGDRYESDGYIVNVHAKDRDITLEYRPCRANQHGRATEGGEHES